ncbi:MAG: hypothetical protein PHS80_08495 [Methanothrix sp.]|nr:hypothetical protein [Methanothrix sp.]MDD4448009.1 hypothetical protein [Methanothrix sp.]
MSYGTLGEAKAMKIIPQKYHVAFVFNTLYYPFTYPEILNSLKSRGYIIQVPPQPLQSGARIYVSGPAVAAKVFDPAKAPCFIELNEPKKIIACNGTVIDNIVASVRDIVDLSRTDFKLNLDTDVNLVELSGSATVQNDNPIDAIKNFSGDRYRVFDEILGAESAEGSIRIIPKNGVQTDKKWFDISIGQRVPSGGNTYYVEFVYRNGNDIASVLDFTANLEEKISAIINKIGGA